MGIGGVFAIFVFAVGNSALHWAASSRSSSIFRKKIAGYSGLTIAMLSIDSPI